MNKRVKSILVLTITAFICGLIIYLTHTLTS